MTSKEDSFLTLCVDATIAAEKARVKFPQPNYVITKFAEEAGEVVQAAVHCAENRESYDNLRAEMVQTIAMLYRLWVEGDQVHGLKPVKDATTRGSDTHTDLFQAAIAGLERENYELRQVVGDLQREVNELRKQNQTLRAGNVQLQRDIRNATDPYGQD